MRWRIHRNNIVSLLHGNYLQIVLLQQSSRSNKSLPRMSIPAFFDCEYLDRVIKVSITESTRSIIYTIMVSITESMTLQNQ